MAIDPKVERIVSVLDRRFKDLVDVSDVAASNKEDNFRSRALIPYVLSDLTGLPDKILADAITDGTNDLGLDGILYNSEDKTLYLAQSKLIKNGRKGVERDEIHALLEGVTKAITNKLTGANSKVLAKVTEIQAALTAKDIKLCILLVHTGDELQDRSQAPLSEKIIALNDHYGEEWVYFEEYDLRKIFEIVVSHETSGDSVDVEIPLMNWNKMSTPHQVFFGAMEVGVLAEWHKVYGKRLFAKNIRNFLGKGEVNNKIIHTLKNEKESFFYLNNGVTILCDTLTMNKKYGDSFEVTSLNAKGIRIVNGAQTVGSIGAFVKMHESDDLVNTKVFVRVISLKGASESIGNKITVATNSQNAINLQDFVSMDATQIRLEREVFSQCNRRYLRLRIALDEMQETDISPEEAAAALCCEIADVRFSTQVKREKSVIFDSFTEEKSIYNKIFNEGTTAVKVSNLVNIKRLTDDFLRKHLATAIEREKSFCASVDMLFLHLVLQGLAPAVKGQMPVADIKASMASIEASFSGIYKKLWDIVDTHTDFSSANPSRMLLSFKKVEALKLEYLK